MTNPLDYTIQDPDAMRYALMQDSSYRGGGRVQRFDEGGQATNYGSAVPQVDAQGNVIRAQPTAEQLMLDRGIAPEGMADWQYAQAQIDRGNANPGHLANALMRILSIPEHLTGSSMGLDPMTGIIGKTGELHSIPKAGQYAASRVAPFATKVDDMVRELHASGAMPQPGLSIKDVSNNLVDHYHGSDTKALSVLDPAASAERRSNGSSTWFKTNDAEASEYPKKKSGSVYTAPLDTSGFAKVDANFTSNKAIHPDAVIYHSNGKITPVSSLGERVTTDDIAAYSKSKGDPGVRILNVGDKGSGRVRSESPYGESVAVHSPVKTTAERSLADIDQPKYYDTPEFKNWFKDSPVIDESGSPLTVYHGGAGDVTEFDASRGKKTAANTTGASEGFNSFTDNPSLASSYAQRAGRKGANVVPAHLSMQNPYIIENAQSHWRALPAPAEMTYFDPKYRQNTTVQKGDMIDINQLARWAKDNGYDGLVVKNVLDPAYEKDRKLGLTNTYVTFKPNQVKSIFNSGEWNPNDPHISKARGGKVSLDQMRHELTKAK